MSGKKEEKTEEIQSESVSEFQPSVSESEKSTEAENFLKRIAELEEENNLLKDQYLRKQAELENYRKRMQREKAETIQFSNKQLLLDLVPIIDDFERAIKSSEVSKDFESFHDGVVLIEKGFINLLERKWGLIRFDSEGEVFDPQRHEAITTEERTDHETSMVLEDYQKGYLLHDKVLRFAKVKVSLPLSAEGKDSESAASKEKEPADS